jgi:two-component system NtrC family sensor kinase
MSRAPQSIRRKIRLGYYAIVVIIGCLSAFTFFLLHHLEKKVMVGEVISEFFDATLEVRRFEKNYFLYEQRSDYEESLRYAARAAELLEANSAGFSALSTVDHVPVLRENFSLYRDLMERYELLIRRRLHEPAESDRALKMRLEGDIRKTGKDIVTVAEEISKTERRTLQSLLTASRRFLIISISVLIALVIAIGQLLERVVVKPLKLMERNMEVIAEGTFENIPIASKDREVLSLTRAFNKMLRELELRQRHLVQSEKLASLGTLLSGVAHELNNPLSNISSSSQILGEELRDARQRPTAGPRPLNLDFAAELAGQINDQTDRARNIVRSLLEFSRDKDFKKQPLQLRQLFEETIRFIKGQVPATVAIRVDVPDELVLVADKQRIQQVFLNLLKNAAEAIPAEGTIAITARQHRAVDKLEDGGSIYNYLRYHGKCTLEDDTVDIEISDTGTGIPADVLPKVFDPFFTTKDVGKGSGLGLFIVHDIIEEHGGCIAVDSDPGKGTTFLIRLPLK